MAWFVCRGDTVLPYVSICSWIGFYGDITVFVFMLFFLLT